MDFRTRRVSATASALLALGAFAGFAALWHSGPLSASDPIILRPGLPAAQRLSANLTHANVAQLCLIYSELTGRMALPRTDGVLKRLDDLSARRLSRWHLIPAPPAPDSGLRYHGDGVWRADELKEELETRFAVAGYIPVAEGENGFRLAPVALASSENEKRAGSPAAARR